MALSHAERGRLGGLKARQSSTPEQRAERARNASRAAHSIERFAQVIAEKAPELSDEQIRQLRGILAPVLASGGASE